MKDFKETLMEYIRETSSMESEMVLEYLSGIMAKYMKVNGKME